MKRDKSLIPALYRRLCSPQGLSLCANRKGQAMVEFTLVFLLLIIIAWIPADFGLAFYTGQLASNAAREGARLAAATPVLPGLPETCTAPSASASELLQQTALRISSALMPGATITLSTATPATCMQNVTMTITGTYNYFFFRLLRLFGIGNALNTANVNITRAATMRWEHQC